MKNNKITSKLWAYSINFLIRAFLINVTIAISIVAFIYRSEGIHGVWSIASISLAGTWLLQLIIGHSIWYSLSVNERALYFAIRKHGGSKVVELTKKEVESKMGQPDIHEILTDVDSGLEIQMIINGTATFINIMIGFRWIIQAVKFHRNTDVFQYHVQ